VLSKNFVYEPSGQCAEGFKNCTKHLCVPAEEVCPVTYALPVYDDDNYTLPSANSSSY